MRHMGMGKGKGKGKRAELVVDSSCRYLFSLIDRVIPNPELPCPPNALIGPVVIYETGVWSEHEMSKVSVQSVALVQQNDHREEKCLHVCLMIQSFQICAFD
jgi:hypothetical protein